MRYKKATRGLIVPVAFLFLLPAVGMANNRPAEITGEGNSDPIVTEERVLNKKEKKEYFSI